MLLLPCLFSCTQVPLAYWIFLLGLRAPRITESQSKTKENATLSHLVNNKCPPQYVSFFGFFPMVGARGSDHGLSYEWMIVLIKWCHLDKNDKYGNSYYFKIL